MTMTSVIVLLVLITDLALVSPIGTAGAIWHDGWGHAQPQTLNRRQSPCHEWHEVGVRRTDLARPAVQLQCQLLASDRERGTCAKAPSTAMRPVVERMVARLPLPLSVTRAACGPVPEDPLDIRGGTASGAITTACVGAVGTPGPRPAPAAEPFLSGTSDPGPRGRRRVCAQPTPATATTGASGCSLALNHVDFQFALPVPVGCRPARKHGSQRYASPYRNPLAPAATWPRPRPGPDRSRTDSSAWLPQTNSNGRAGGC